MSPTAGLPRRAAIGFRVLVLANTLIASVALVLAPFLFNAIREAAVNGCERQNTVRQAVRQQLHDQNVNSRDLPPSFFPGIPADQFDELLRQGIVARQSTIEKLSDADCESEYQAVRSN